MLSETIVFFGTYDGRIGYLNTKTGYQNSMRMPELQDDQIICIHVLHYKVSDEVSVTIQSKMGKIGLAKYSIATKQWKPLIIQSTKQVSLREFVLVSNLETRQHLIVSPQRKDNGVWAV